MIYSSVLRRSKYSKISQKTNKNIESISRNSVTFNRTNHLSVPSNRANINYISTTLIVQRREGCETLHVGIHTLERRSSHGGYKKAVTKHRNA